MRHRDDVRASVDDVPLVGRPRGAAWRALQADGIVWEGQVFLVGGDVDLAARMIVTHNNVAFVRGGQVALEVQRSWLRPAPILERDGTLVLSILPPNATPYTLPETIPLRMRDGHPATGHLIAMFAGSGARRLPAEAAPRAESEAGKAPALPAISDDWLLPRPERMLWDEPRPRPDTSSALVDVPRSRQLIAQHPATDGSRSRNPLAEEARARRDELDADLDPVVRQPAPPVASGPNRDWNQHPLIPVRHLMPRTHRRNRWSWVLRLGGLALLILLAALFGAGRLPTSFAGGSPTESIATAPADSGTAPPEASDDPSTASADVAARQTAVALGVGGQDDETPTAAPATIAPTVPVPAAPGITGGSDASSSAAAASQAAAGESDDQSATDRAIAATPDEEADAAPAAAPATAQAAVATATEETVETLRVEIEKALRGTSLREFALTRSRDGEWVGLIATVTNDGDAAVETAMDDIVLVAQPGDVDAAVDTRTGVVAGVLGIEPAFGPGDVVALEPGESARLVLIFVVPPEAEALTLQFGQRSLDVEPAES